MVAFRSIEKSSLTPAADGPAAAMLDSLRGRVAGLEAGPADAALEVMSTGVEAVDRALPWGGLPVHGLHEIAGWKETDLALAFAARLLAREGETRPFLWCQSAMGADERGRLYGPGLAARGLDPSRFLFVTARREKEALWAMEEALTSGAVAGVAGEIEALGMTETRRLQLAAMKGGAMALVLRGPVGDRAPAAALTRWRAEPAETAQRGFPFLSRSGACGAACPANWMVEQDAETFHLALAPALADRPARA
ncbi:MAG: ImuA family protein [Minwuia sp.]|uniref:ImuA family protein n=1 Tax=Minwuia sp. TaxID=2493630 RepID=UPI003A894A25